MSGSSPDLFQGLCGEEVPDLLQGALSASLSADPKGTNVFGTDAVRGERWIGHATTRLKLSSMTTQQSLRKRGSGASSLSPYVGTNPTKAEAASGASPKLQSLT